MAHISSHQYYNPPEGAPVPPPPPTPPATFSYTVHKCHLRTNSPFRHTDYPVLLPVSQKEHRFPARALFLPEMLRSRAPLFPHGENIFSFARQFRRTFSLRTNSLIRVCTEQVPLPQYHSPPYKALRFPSRVPFPPLMNAEFPSPLPKPFPPMRTITSALNLRSYLGPYTTLYY